MCDIDDNGDELNQWWLYGDDDDDENSDDVDHDGDAHGVDGDAVSTLRFCHEWFNDWIVCLTVKLNAMSYSHWDSESESVQRVAHGWNPPGLTL